MMNQEDIFKKIGHIVNELNDQYQYLAQNPQELNELELELFLANTSFLTDHVQIIRKLNTTTAQKALPEHTASLEPVQETITLGALEQEEIPAAEVVHEKPILEQEIFKPDNGASTFEFILNDKPSTDRFEFEEKSIDEIFDRPLSREEEEIIALKQKLRESDSLESDLPEEDEIGPEPFLVEHDPEPAYIEEDLAAHEDIKEAEPATAVEEESFTKPFPPIDAEPIMEQVVPPVAAEPIKPEASPIQAFAEPVVEEVIPPVVIEPVKTETAPAEPAFVPAPAEAAPAVKLTLNDILSGNTQGSAAKTEGSRAPITDLKQAISLNDKLRYIRDLFNGYNLAYAEAIDLLNKMPDFRTADAFLQNNYAVKNNWSAKQETADHFYELLNQRFPAK